VSKSNLPQTTDSRCIIVSHYCIPCAFKNQALEVLERSSLPSIHVEEEVVGVAVGMAEVMGIVVVGWKEMEMDALVVSVVVVAHGLW
jgi:hypothetical protein